MSSDKQMFYVNVISGCFILISRFLPRRTDFPFDLLETFTNILSISAVILKSELIPSIYFVIENPMFGASLLGLSFSSMLGQKMLYLTIKHLGALFYASVMTTRQVFSITLSCVIYLHPLTFPQICGAALVFISIYLRTVLKQTKQPQKKEPVLHV